jgi:hypothetical protein
MHFVKAGAHKLVVSVQGHVGRVRDVVGLQQANCIAHNANIYAARVVVEARIFYKYV